MQDGDSDARGRKTRLEALDGCGVSAFPAQYDRPNARPQAAADGLQIDLCLAAAGDPMKQHGARLPGFSCA